MKRIFNFLKSDIGRIVPGAILFIAALILEQNSFFAVSLAAYVLAILAVGGEVFVSAAKGILRRDLLDEKFLMSVAAVGAMIIGEFSEGVAVMLFFRIGEAFEHRAVRKSRASIRSLMDICPDEARILTEDGEIIVDAEDVEIGSILVIRPGERVPVDAIVTFGSADVDTSSMTGEPMPVSVSVGSDISSGYIVKNGLIHARTVRLSGESAAARVLSLVENANERKSREESFITVFSRYYTPIVVLIALAVAIIPPIIGRSGIDESVHTALSFLVISCPCALVISVPMAFFGGIGGAASKGILFKGGNVFSKVAQADTVAFDKTGTITNGKFTVIDVISYSAPREQIIRIAASAESASNHPVAECISTLCEDPEPPFSATEHVGLGIVAELSDGECAVGNLKLMEKIGVSTVGLAEQSAGAVYVALGKRLIGAIILSDSIKTEASKAVEYLVQLGVKRSVILSGDIEANVMRVAGEVGISDVGFGLTPEQKFERLEALIESSRSTMYVGDGINDSPSLARADVGIAMGSIGQDSAIEAADMVIMTDNLMKIPEAMLIARKTINISRQNIIFALGVKLVILILGLIGYTNMWLAVFADVGVAILAILNSMRALRAPKI